MTDPLPDPSRPDPPREQPKPRPGEREQAAPSPTRPVYPVYELTVAGVRELDRRAIEDCGIPGIVLMENAARNLREHSLDLLARARRPDAVILVGPGNNGGDGLALARHLDLFGVPVSVVLATTGGTGDALRGDAAVNLGIVRRMGMAIGGPETLPEEPPGLIVDALFGTGLSRPPQSPASDLIEWANTQRGLGSLMLAVDVPSGLDAMTGEPLGECCIRADRTVTLAAIKPGLTRLEAQAFLGDLSVVDIGAPKDLLAELGTLWRGLPG